MIYKARDQKARKSIFIGFVMVLCLSAIVQLVRENQNTSTSEALNREKLKNESLLTEKLVLQKQIFKDKQNLERAIGQTLATERERAPLTQLNYQYKRNMNWAEKRIMNVLRNNQHLNQVVDSLRQQLMIHEQEFQGEKQTLRDSIIYLQELSQTLSAELHGRINNRSKA